eukprot:59331-Rhodomonas_salina.1
MAGCYSRVVATLVCIVVFGQTVSAAARVNDAGESSDSKLRNLDCFRGVHTFSEGLCAGVEMPWGMCWDNEWGPGSLGAKASLEQERIPFVQEAFPQDAASCSIFIAGLCSAANLQPRNQEASCEFLCSDLQAYSLKSCGNPAASGCNQYPEQCCSYTDELTATYCEDGYVPGTSQLVQWGCSRDESTCVRLPPELAQRTCRDHTGISSIQKDDVPFGMPSMRLTNAVSLAVLGCVGPSCGDGIENQDSEVCDDKNTVGGDGCSSGCQVIPLLSPDVQCDARR